MPDSFDIRPVAAEDHSEWLTLWERYLVFYESSLPEATTALLWRRLQDPGHPFRCFVAVDMNTQRLVGIVHFFAHPDTWEAELVCYLQDLYVDEPVRGGGVGAALIEAVHDESERCGWASVYWQTKHDNTRARGLYDKLAGGDGWVHHLSAEPLNPSRERIEDYVDRIDAAVVYEVATRTPLELAENLSARLGNRILLKREDLQPVFSFKLRGAYNKIASLSKQTLGAGVICSSAGNHAQGVALAARRKGVSAVVVMPVTTPSIKVEAVRALGGQVLLHGDTYDDAYVKARELEKIDGLTFIHPFDDPAVIAGQGTIGKEILEQADEAVSAVFVPIGGGGLISGIAAYIKAKRPEIRIIGVEPEDSAVMRDSVAAGERIVLEHVGIFADGVAVKQVGEETLRVCRELVDDFVTVDTDQICAAIRDIFEDTRSIVEPAGALAVAGAKRYLAERATRGETVVVINCGANVNFDRLRHIAERAAVGDQEEMLLAVEIPEERGSFKAFSEAVGRRGVTEFNYRYSDPKNAHIFVGIQLRRGARERAELIETLRGHGYPLVDLSDDELAKLHIRHMVGGRAANLENERLFRFEFPERPGALLDFLTAIGAHWNVSLFHYRNHGSDHGRVLAGIQVPEEEADELEAHLTELGYPHWEESDNPAYAMFLA